MDYSLLVGIHNCDAVDHYQQQQQLDLGDGQTSSDVVHGGGATVSSSDELDSSGSAGTPPDSPQLTPRRQRTVSFTADLDPCLELFAIKCAEREFIYAAL